MQENKDKKTLNMDNFQADVSHCLQLNDGIGAFSSRCKPLFAVKRWDSYSLSTRFLKFSNHRLY